MVVEELVGCGIGYIVLAGIAVFAGLWDRYCPCYNGPVVQDPRYYI